MTDARGSSNAAGILALVAGMLAGCGGGSSGGDAGPATCGRGDGGPAKLCVGVGATSPLCTSSPALASVTDLSGTWVLETIGAQTVSVPAYANPFHLKSINVILVQVVQNGNDVTLNGQYCDRIQHDDPSNPAQVIVLDRWRGTPSTVQRAGTFALDSSSGQWTLTLPTLVEVFGATLTDPVCEALPTGLDDLRLVDVDNDGYPGLSVGLGGTGSLISGTLRSVQRQATALHGLAVAAERVEGGMAYESDESVVASDPANLRCLYLMATSSADPAVCRSSFVMVKVPDVTDAGAVNCDWVRANESALLGL
jgi:hypothetical protein